MEKEPLNIFHAFGKTAKGEKKIHSFSLLSSFILISIYTSIYLTSVKKASKQKKCVQKQQQQKALECEKNNFFLYILNGKKHCIEAEINNSAINSSFL